MSPVKEPSYFASEVRPSAFAEDFRCQAAKNAENLRRFLDNPVPGAPHPEGIVAKWEDYLKLFRGVTEEQAIGEASVVYLWSETAAANIHAAIPNARIIMILRDPAERAFSQYLHNARDGVVRGSFRKQIGLATRNKWREFHPLYPFLENGLYYQQVQRYLNLFPRENVRIFLYEEAWSDPPALIKDIFEFLGVDPGFSTDLSRRELERRAPRSMTANYLLNRSSAGACLRRWLPGSLRSRLRTLLFKPRAVTMDSRDRRYLRDFYREDVDRLAELLARDLRIWLD